MGGLFQVQKKLGLQLLIFFSLLEQKATLSTVLLSCHFEATGDSVNHGKFLCFPTKKSTNRPLLFFQDLFVFSPSRSQKKKWRTSVPVQPGEDLRIHLAGVQVHPAHRDLRAEGLQQFLAQPDLNCRCWNHFAKAKIPKANGQNGKTMENPKLIPKK